MDTVAAAQFRRSLSLLLEYIGFDHAEEKALQELERVIGQGNRFVYRRR